jgi:alkylhydroperoxidase/carboxymuconolactone decarboxylase family protein YurZ
MPGPGGVPTVDDVQTVPAAEEPTVPDTDQTPVLDVIAAMTAASLETCELPPDAIVLVRLAALAAVGARPVSYLAHVGPSMETGITIEDVQNVLVAVAPIIGTARTMTAAVNIAEALGFAIDILAADIAAGADA